MASDTPNPDQSAQDGATETKDAADEGPSLSIITQYTKDLSFENPLAPTSLAGEEGQPHGDVSVKVKSRQIADKTYEVVLEFEVKATQGEAVAFIVELAYGGVFRIAGFEEPTLSLVTMVECPRILFPFARRIIADSVRDGGFAPLMLQPIDFLALYQQHHAAAGGNGGLPEEDAEATFGGGATPDGTGDSRDDD